MALRDARGGSFSPGTFKESCLVSISKVLTIGLGFHKRALALGCRTVRQWRVRSAFRRARLWGIGCPTPLQQPLLPRAGYRRRRTPDPELRSAIVQKAGLFPSRPASTSP